MPSEFATSSTAALSRAAISPELIRTYFVSSSNTDTITEGYVLCFDQSQSTVADRSLFVTKPAINNINRPAGIVVGSQSVTGGQRVHVLPFESVIPGVPVYTDQNITTGDVLGPQPNTYALRRGLLFGGVGAIAIESVDRSSTAGLVTTDIHRIVPDSAVRQSQMDLFDDFNSFTTAHEGWVAIAASGTVAGPAAGSATSIGGAVVLTPQAADNASAIIHRQLVGGGFLTATGKAWLIEAVVSGAVDTNSGYFFGLVDAAQTIAATLPITDAGAMTADIDAAYFHKTEGTSTWTTASVGAATSSGGTAGATSAFAINTDYRLQIMYDGVGGISWFINGVQIGSRLSTAAALPVSTVAMVPVIQSKNGSGTAAAQTVRHFRGVQVK